MRIHRRKANELKPVRELRKARMSLVLPEELRDRLQKIAYIRCYSFNEVANQAVAAYAAANIDAVRQYDEEFGEDNV